MDSSVHAAIRKLLIEKLLSIEEKTGADVISYTGPILDGNEGDILNIIEELTTDKKRKKDKLVIILTTTGGSAFAVERYVNIIRSHYKIVDFIIPDYAYSAGTIFCMSGDNIIMDYSSVLGPIDPQVQNNQGKWVAALGYLDKVNEAIEKSKAGTLSQAEFLMIRDLDLAELRSYEQAKELTIELLKNWLVKYKFKNWEIHNTNPDLKGMPVTVHEKEQRAADIANQLNNNGTWKSHGRPINMQTLGKMGLKIEDIAAYHNVRTTVRDYYKLLADYVITNNFTIFVQSRNLT